MGESRLAAWATNSSVLVALLVQALVPTVAACTTKLRNLTPWVALWWDGDTFLGDVSVLLWQPEQPGKDAERVSWWCCRDKDGTDHLCENLSAGT